MEDKKVTAVIVEDEPTAREVLRTYLRKYCPDVAVIAEAADAKEAIRVLHETKPELVFMDVEMPHGTGFDVLDACNDLNFQTIFVTAYAHYSIQALNQSAAYYLLKPLNIDALIEAVTTAKTKMEQSRMLQHNQIISANVRETNQIRRQIIIPTLEGFEVVKAQQIIRLQGNGNFTDIYLDDGTKKMACRFLKHYDENLTLPFLRVHKSHIINTDYVKSYSKSGGGVVTLADGSEVDVSPTYKEEFLKYFT